MIFLPPETKDERRLPEEVERQDASRVVGWAYYSIHCLSARDKSLMFCFATIE
jgi:hypothetical protein